MNHDSLMKIWFIMNFKAEAYLVVFMSDSDPVVVGDDPLVERQDSLVPRLQPTNLING